MSNPFPSACGFSPLELELDEKLLKDQVPVLTFNHNQ
jgi:hypothetical protein